MIIPAVITLVLLGITFMIFCVIDSELIHKPRRAALWMILAYFVLASAFIPVVL